MKNVANPKIDADGVNFSTLMTLTHKQAISEIRLSKLSKRYDNLESVVVNMLQKYPYEKFQKKMKERLKQISSL